MGERIGNIHLFMGPRALGAPDDLLEVVVEFISGAQKKLFIAVQEVDNRKIAEAIIAAKMRGVTVKLVIEGDYLKELKPAVNPFLALGDNEANRLLQNAILRASVEVRSDYNPGIFHQKFIVRDSESVLTGSTNFTDTDTTVNLNNILIVHDRAVAGHFEDEFAEIQEGHFGKLNEGHDKVPAENLVSGIRVKTLFAPDHNPEMEIMKQVAKAKKSVDFAIFTFAQSSGIDDQLVLAKRSGIRIRGALFESQANQDWASTEVLKNAGIEFYRIPGPKAKGTNLRKLHHKIMVIDGQLVITGSFNYTGAANTINDENIVVLGDLDSTDRQSIQGQKTLGDFVLREIDRIISTFG